MASIDRYRPAREGYKPPTANRRDYGASKSPTQRRDVPPAVPTPPQNSSRNSPPRTYARAGHQSPNRSGAQTPLANYNQWAFSQDEINSSPTILDGIAPSEERLRRAKGINFIYQAGVALDLPQITLWVAGVFFHRFFMRVSMAPEKQGIHHYNIAATALFLANKTEENCRKTKDIIITVAKVAQKNNNLIIDEQSKEYWRWRDSILTYEEVMLEQLTFDLMIDNPYRNLFDLLGQLEIVHNKQLRQAAWAFCNDACLTTLPLLMDARDVAISAIFFASIHTNQQIDDFKGEAWWRYLRGSEDRITRAIETMRQFYTDNPLRKQNPSLPSPAFDLESSRRKGESYADNMSSTAATPMEIDRTSKSPLPRANGASHERDSEHHASQSSNRIPMSPSKRKMPEDGSRLQDERDEKRARMSEDEEGELVED